MVHILLLILKIIGIILLTVLALCLLVLFFPVTYRGKGEFHGKVYCIDLKCGWLFHLLHFGGRFSNEKNIAKIRILGVPINLLKDKSESEKKRNSKKNKEKHKKRKKEKTSVEEKISEKQVGEEQRRKEQTNQSQSEDLKKQSESRDLKKQSERKEGGKTFADKIKDFCRMILRFAKKIKEAVKKAVKDIKGAYNKAKEIKAFITANTTKEAYRYGKRIVFKVLKHIFPRKIKAKLHFGFEQPDVTGKTLGYIAMILSTFHINAKRISVVPDFDKKVIEGNINIKGHFFVGILLIDGLRFYFKKEIHDIIKRFS